MESVARGLGDKQTAIIGSQIERAKDEGLSPGTVSAPRCATLFDTTL